MTPVERSWVGNALAASDYMMEQRLGLPAYPHPTIILFNDECRFEKKEGSDGWSGEPHAGQIRIGTGSVRAGVWAMQDFDKKAEERFVLMSLLSIWEEAKLATPGDKGLTAVFLHEFSHARQDPVLREIFAVADAKYEPPEYFNDDSLQKHFETDPAYVAVWEKEAALLYQAAAEPDDAKALTLAKQALGLMDARQQRWFVGPEAMWKRYDDLFLTMEGIGQWTAYAWLSDPKGGGMTADAAREKMRGRRRQWSQEEGLGLFLVIDRFVPGWPQLAFAAEPKLAIDLLRMAVAEKPEAAAAD